ncbi:hypothetical protein [Alkalilimnicola ehrlichii]|uniref:hypothetical protein n=1 Tax=Alkalilimnicola ehrlichii TaxID=351052 RepID=UPI003BA04AFA
MRLIAPPFRLLHVGLILLLMALLTACGGGSSSTDAPSEDTYPVGGTLTGLEQGHTVTLQLNGANDLTLDHTANDNPYSFAVKLPHGSAYEVTLPAEPSQHHCTIHNATGTVDGAVMNVDVECTAFPVLAAGDDHTVAVKADGTLWAWGRNGYGRLGLGDTDDRDVPEQVGTDSDWTAVSAGRDHTVAVKANGTLSRMLHRADQKCSGFRPGECDPSLGLKLATY